MDFLTEVKGQAIREPAAKIPFSELGQLGLGQMAIFCLFLIMLFLQQSCKSVELKICVFACTLNVLIYLTIRVVVFCNEPGH